MYGNKNRPIVQVDNKEVKEQIAEVDDRLSSQLAEKAKLIQELGVNVKDFGAKGDWNGTTGTDDTQAFKDAVIYASEQGIKKMYVPSGKYLLSSYVDMLDVSISGASAFTSILVADKTAPLGNWRYLTTLNDVAMLLWKNQKGIVATNLGVDGQDVYTGGIIASGGEDIIFSNNHVKNLANATLQFIGSRSEGYQPVRNGIMSNNIVENSRWSLVIDGECYDILLENNICLNATNRHISIDPEESFGTTKSSVTVIGNVCKGRREFPESWLSDPSWAVHDSAIGTKGHVEFIISNNKVLDWDSEMGIRIWGSTGKVHGNVISNENTTKLGKGISIEQSENVSVSENDINNTHDGIWSDNLPSTNQIRIKNNTFANVDEGREVVTPSVGAPRFIKYGNIKENGFVPDDFLGDLINDRIIMNRISTLGTGKVTKWENGKIECSHTITLVYDTSDSLKFQWQTAEHFLDTSFEVVATMKRQSGTLTSTKLKEVTLLRADPIATNQVVVSAYSLNSAFVSGDELIVSVIATGRWK